MPAVAAAEVHARRAIATWALDDDGPLDMRIYRGPNELAGHTLSLTEMRTSEGSSVTSAGCDMSTAQAVGASIAELAERFVARSWQPQQSRRSSEKSLRAKGERVFDVSSYVGRPRYPHRWPCPPYTDERELVWVHGETMFTREPVWVPLSLVRLAPATGSDAIAEVTTIGLAAGRSTNAAEQHALLELIERDALMLAWNAGHSLVRLVNGAADVGSEWEHDLLWTRSEFAVDVFLVLLRNSSRNLYSIGMSAKLDPAEGRAHALAEALQIRMEVNSKQLTSVDHITSFPTRNRFYSHPTRLGELDALVSSVTETARFEPTPMNVVLDRFRARGIEPVRVVLLEDTAKAVVRVLAPGLQPMDADASFSRLVDRSTATHGRPHPFG